MATRKSKVLGETPVYCLDDFSQKAKDNEFYIESLPSHLAHHPFVSHPHKHDFYLILFITKGGGDHTIDFHNYAVSPGSVFLMTPGQVHAWNLQPGTDGYIIFFDRSFYQFQLHENNLIDFPFFHSLQATPHLHMQPDATIDALIHEMNTEYQTNAASDHRMLRACLDLLLLKLARIYPVKNERALNTNTFKLRKLEQLIEKHFIKRRQPGEYAELMNVSPNYLNSICKQNLGKTLSDLIQDRVVLEAKRRFAYTDLTVTQVSHQLNFSEPSYFIRFFKKKTGITPETFKETLTRAIQ